MNIKVNFDGSCEPINPGGRMGFGAIIFDGNRTMFEGSGSVPASPSNSNNVAEYMALELALQWLIDNRMTEEKIIIRGDSMLVINQMSGAWRANGGLYFRKYLNCKKLLANFSFLKFEWISRVENEQADNLSRSK